MVAEVRPDYDTGWAAMKAVAAKLGIGTSETLRKWVRQNEIDAGTRPGTTTEESAQIKAMKKEVAELKRASEILGAAAFFSRPSPTGRTHVRSVHRRVQGPLRRRRADLPCADRARLQDRPVHLLHPPQTRDGTLGPHTVRDTELKILIQEAYDANYRLYGARKIWISTEPGAVHTAPFYKADREQEMKAAHARFTDRLQRTNEAGEWTRDA